MRAAQEREGERFRKKRALRLWRQRMNGTLKKFPNGFWKSPDHVRWLTRAFVRRFRARHKRYPHQQDWYSAKLASLLHIFNGSTYEPLVFAGLTDPRDPMYDRVLHETPWVAMDHVPHHFWEREENRARAVRWLVTSSGKRPSEIEDEDFQRAGLSALIAYYGWSPLGALQAAGYRMLPWERGMAPNRYWERKANRVSAIRWLVSRTGKRPEALEVKDFVAQRLGGLLARRYRHLVEAVQEAGYDVHPTDLSKVPSGYWHSKQNRVRATRQLVASLGKRPAQVTREDLIRSGLRTLLNRHIGSVHSVLNEAGYRTTPPLLRARRPQGFWKSKKNRVAAIRWLVGQCGKRPEDITLEDFRRHRLLSMLAAWYGPSPKRALQEAGYRIDPLRTKARWKGKWDDPLDITRLAREVARRVGKRPAQLIRRDFDRAGFGYVVEAKGWGAIAALAGAAAGDGRWKKNQR